MSSQALGFYGKLPTVGDFVGRGWDSATRDGLDKVLQQALGTLVASSTLGRAAVTEAPDLAFAFKPGVLAPRGLLVVMIPSADRVGRTFPLTAGVQIDAQDFAWPGIEFVRALISRLRDAVDRGLDPDAVLGALASAGTPDRHPPTHFEVTGDETMPRMGANVQWFHVRGPQAGLSQAVLALCSVLTTSCNMLGLRLGGDGAASDFFACRRLESAEPLASVFDGQWALRGWSSYGLPPALPPAVAKEPEQSIPTSDDDATRPRGRVVDRVVTSADSPSSEAGGSPEAA